MDYRCPSEKSCECTKLVSCHEVHFPVGFRSHDVDECQRRCAEASEVHWQRLLDIMKGAKA